MSIDHAAGELKCPNLTARLSDRLNFGMRRRVHILFRTIMRDRDDLTSPDDTGLEWHFTLLEPLPGHLNGKPHKIRIGHRFRLSRNHPKDS